MSTTLSFATLKSCGIDPDAAIAYLYELYGFDTDKFSVEGDSIALFFETSDENDNGIPDILDSLIHPSYVVEPSDYGHGG